MVKTDNIREITKKDNVRGLSRNAWIASSMITIIAFIFFLLYGLVIGALAVIVLAIMEYFDEDIYDIIFINCNNSFKRNYYA